MNIERFAIMAAKGNNGGEWATHYTEEQKEYWRQFVRELLAAERERCVAEKAAATVTFAVVVDKLRTELAAERERCAKLLEAMPKDLTWWDVAGVVEKIRKGEVP